MTTKLPFTALSLARAIKGVRDAGMHVVGVRADGTLIVADEPVKIASFVPPVAQDDPHSKWDRRG
jgi:hypothetical protein